MNSTVLAQWQFAITTVYHFFFVPLTLGLSVMLAIMETLYVRTGDETYKTMTKFWGKLFLINFAMGVATGIVQEFQFGMNWSEYSRYVGDIFGAPLAIEALLAFFLESTFLGVWIFGWDRLSKGLHAAVMWLVAIGSNLSALWILIANSFMQQPMGYVINEVTSRAEMASFKELVFNPNAWVMFPHVVLGGFSTAAFFVLGISAYHLLKDHRQEVFRRSFQIAAIFGLITITLVGLGGHTQAQHMVEIQPMKMAAAEALWHTEDPASFSLLTIGDLQEQEIFSIRIPYALSLLAYNSFSGEIKGIYDLQAEYEAIYGPGDYVPPIAITYWSFRLMVGAGLLMGLLAIFAVYKVVRQGAYDKYPRFMRYMVYAISLPYLANSTGWLMTEIGRQPWVVYGLLKTEDAVSPSVSAGEVWASLIIFTLLYGILMVADLYLLTKYARKGPEDEALEPALVAA